MFSKLIGNGLAKDILSSIVIKKAFPHALLFSGPSGVGKRQFALTLAKAILGNEHARKIDGSLHPDVRVFYPEGKSGMHLLSSIHQMQQQMAVEPFEAKSRVFIIDQAHKMPAASSNALLKTLEEPPEGNYLILLTHQPEEILPTIHSRCRKIPFFSIGDKEISLLLQSGYAKTEVEAKKLAYLSYGSIGQALFLMKDASESRPAIVAQILSTPPFNPLRHSALVSQLEEHIIAHEEEASRFYAQIDLFFEEIYYWYRDLHLLSAAVDPSLLFHFDSLSLLEPLSRHPLVSLEEVDLYIRQAKTAIDRGMKIRYVFEYLLMSLMAARD
ncbi:MAG: AAA family ATPase [Chlamydiae bacterium]|nr:AAA family ATPase [Chlamydiota bacterium]